MNFSLDTLAWAGLIIALFLRLRSDIKELATTVDKQAERIDSPADRVSRLEGLIKGLLRPRLVWPPDYPDKPSGTARTGTDG